MEEINKNIQQVPEIQIIHEEDSFLVINKPAGITVNIAETTRHELTIQDWMEQRYRINNLGQKTNEISISLKREGQPAPKATQSITGVGEDEKFQEPLEDNEQTKWDPKVDFYHRGGVVHRLDKETSGILLLAKNSEAFAKLQDQFKQRIVQKTYLALAHGKVVPEIGEISVPVGRLPWNRKQFGIVPGGRESVTNYKVLEYYRSRGGNKEELSLIELYPHTGRTHQIRVHMKYIGHPLFADFLYAGRKTSRNDRRVLERVFLHAVKISFQHPVTGEQLTFEAPLPEELNTVIKQMEKV